MNSSEVTQDAVLCRVTSQTIGFFARVWLKPQADSRQHVQKKHLQQAVAGRFAIPAEVKE